MSLDVFDGDCGFWGTVLGLFMHNIPALILLAVLLISWRHERGIIGGSVFILAGLLYIFSILLNNYRLKPIGCRKYRAEALPLTDLSVDNGKIISSFVFVVILALNIFHDHLVSDIAGGNGVITPAPEMLTPKLLAQIGKFRKELS
jgi:hypothetical protein